MTLTTVKKTGLENIVSNDADNRILTATGTSSSLNGEANLTFDGDTLKFTHDAVTGFDSNSQDFLVIENGDSDTYINIGTETSRDSGLIFSDDTRARGWYGYNHSGDYAYIGTAGSERFRIKSDGQVNLISSCLTTFGANTTNEAACIKVGYEGSSKGQVRVYGADASTTGSLEFKVSEGDGTAAHTMLFDSGGRLLIGTTDTGDSAADDLVIGDGQANRGISIRAATDGWSSIYFADGISSDANYRGIITYDHTNDALKFSSAGWTATPDVTINSNGNLEIGDGNLVLASTHGISFDPHDAAVSSPGSDSNLLDDYEEGTFTPTIGTNGSALDPAPGYTVQVGEYTKVGNLVTCNVYVSWNSAGAGGSGTIGLFGLPFTISSHGSYTGVSFGWSYWSHAGLYENNYITAYGQSGQAYALFLYQRTHSGSSGNADWAMTYTVVDATFAHDEGSFSCTISYHV